MQQEGVGGLCHRSFPAALCSFILESFHSELQKPREGLDEAYWVYGFDWNIQQCLRTALRCSPIPPRWFACRFPWFDCRPLGAGFQLAGTALRWHGFLLRGCHHSEASWRICCRRDSHVFSSEALGKNLICFQAVSGRPQYLFFWFLEMTSVVS